MGRLLLWERVACAVVGLALLLPSALYLPGQRMSPCVGIPPGSSPTWSLDGHPEVGAMAPTIQSVLDEAYVSYRGPRGLIEGFVPGPIYRYPHAPVPFYLFARDTATIVPMARYSFSAGSMRSALEEFLRLQYADDTVSSDGDLGQPVGAGALSGTIAPDFSVNKATITSDEEPSAILTAVSYVRQSGDLNWLGSDVSGTSVLDRLDAAMDWLLAHRFDPGIDLIKRGHTTDWGDVKMEIGPQPTDISLFHVWAYSIYDQALAVAALRGLAEMNLDVGRDDVAQRYLSIAERIRTASDARLWIRDRGYYRLHLHVADTPYQHPFDEDEIVAIGNAAALYYGLAGADKAGSIVNTLEAARLEANSPKAGLTLQPAYPSGEFLQIQMAERKYQNGAQWDWWAGRQISAEYWSGYSRFGDAHLLQVAQSWATHPGEVFEWESPWTDENSLDNRYAGAAAVVGESVVAGLFGISMRASSLEIAPRLGTRGGTISVRDATTGVDVSYAYAYEPRGQTASICYETTFDGPITLRPLTPEGLRLDNALLDGAPVGFVPDALNDDRFSRFDAPSGVHTLTLNYVADTP